LAVGKRQLAKAVGSETEDRRQKTEDRRQKTEDGSCQRYLGIDYPGPSTQPARRSFSEGGDPAPSTQHPAPCNLQLDINP